jgi:phage repressor protein C with HTH and peptisase S24 domain
MAEVSTGISMEQLQTILAAQAAQTKEIVAAAVKAAKEPTEEDAAKKAEEKRRYDLSRKQARAQQEAEERSKRQRQLNCSHKKENGKWATGGQVIGERFGMIICQHCQKSWFATFSTEVISQLNSGDLTLHMADPTQAGWKDEPPVQEAAA